MDGQVTLALDHTRKAPPIRECEFSLASEAAEYRDDVLRRLVSFIDDEHAPMCHRPQQR